MNDDTYDDIAKQLEAADPDSPQILDEASSNEEAHQVEQTNQNFAFFTPTEAGIRPTDPNDIPGAPRPQPGMTFTPTGGSVSDVQHQLHADDDNADTTIVRPTNNQE